MASIQGSYIRNKLNKAVACSTATPGLVKFPAQWGPVTPGRPALVQWAAPGANRCWFASALRIKVLARTPPCFSTGCSLSHTGSHAHCAYSLRHAECRARFSWLCCGLGPYVLIGLGIMLLSLPITGRLSRDMMGKTMAKLKFADERTRVCEV